MGVKFLLFFTGFTSFNVVFYILVLSCVSLASRDVLLFAYSI